MCVIRICLRVAHCLPSPGFFMSRFKRLTISEALRSI
jgi:hypothetical protein